MSLDQLETAGAFALYRAEQGHRVAEFGKAEDADARIRRDFEAYRGRYVRKFQDILASLAEQGLEVRPGA
jgi:hypothetical protein